MQKFLSLFFSPFLGCRSFYYCLFQLCLMSKSLFSFISHSSHAEAVIIVHFKFLRCRSSDSHLLHLFQMQKLFFLFILPSSNAEIPVLFFVLPSSYSCWFYLPPTQKFLFLLISRSSCVEVVILVHSCYSHAEIFIFVQFTFIACCFPCSFPLSPMWKMLFSFISFFFNGEIVILAHFTFF